MNSRIEDDKLILELTGRIDTNNANQIDAEIAGIISANPGLVPVFDAEKLEYISSIGLPAEQILKIGKMFFAKYTGISNPEEMEAYFKKLGLLFAFNVSLVIGTEAETATKLAPMLMDKLLRGVVIPNEQAVRHLLSNLNSF